MVSYNKNDLLFILDQIEIAEQHAAGTPLTQLVVNPLLPWGLRTVDGSFNNIIAGREEWGSADLPFPRLVPTSYGTGTGDPTFDINGPAPGGTGVGSSYAPLAGLPQNVVDIAPRTISNLLVDQTANNPAAVIAALEFAGVAAAQIDAAAADIAAAAELDRAARKLEKAYVTAYDAAVAADARAAAAATAVDALSTALNADGTVDPGDIAAANAAVAAAAAAASTTQSAATALAYDANVQPADLAEATAIAQSAAQLLLNLQNLRTALDDGTVDAADLTAVGAAVALATQVAADANALPADLQPDRDAAVAAATATDTDLKDTVTSYGIEITDNGTLVIPNIAPDEGISAPFNSWMTLFGQFFDHGLDLVEKTATTKVYVPLQPDDPLYVPGGHSNFMVVTRTMPDARNVTTPLVDQNQTYTSHASHQVFLREYVVVAGEVRATGHLLERPGGGLATWADVKTQAADILGLRLSDVHVTKVPLLATDEYGRYLRGTDGFAQVVVRVTDTAGNSRTVNVSGVDQDTDNLAGLDLLTITTTNLTAAQLAGLTTGAGALNGNVATYTVAVEFTGHAFLDDISHTANPLNSAGAVRLADDNATAGDHLTGVGDDGRPMANNQVGSGSAYYDDELLARHFITGDGRGNENIGLTAVHHVFHSEHNRLVEHTKDTVVATGDLAFINQWLLTPITAAEIPTTPAGIDALSWNGERLFQAARFGTEMQYQHLVFEEFARKVVPSIELFVFNPTLDINPEIFAEFAHAVYRFGHSMLTETVDRMDAGGQTSNDIGLIEAFLNPVAFDADFGLDADVAAGAIIRGMTRQQGNEIDEFVTEALRNNLVGLPLDLATVNIVRGRETGIPKLNSVREEFFDATRSDWLRPYTSWVDFSENLKNFTSVINFIAAYGTHTSITGATTFQDKRDAAALIVLGGTGAPTDRIDFLNATGAYAGGSLGGLNDVDLWIGGLAEAILPFGGMLGSTFTFVFQKQLENLQNGDRFYYLSRTQGMHFLSELEANSFASLVKANTDLGADGATHLPGDLFAKVDHILEVNQAIQLEDDPVHANPVLQALNPKVNRNSDVTIDAAIYDNYLKFLGGEHVVLGGTNENDALIAQDGDDSLWGDDGDDFLDAGHGVNRIHGGDGNDIIYDGGDASFIHADGGNDVISAGEGLGELIFAGAGHDFVLAVKDAKEVFGAEGNDFIKGTQGGDFLLGGEGDDWIEGGEGFDTLAGENSELFFNSIVIGHDVLFSGTNETDFDAESGDDIMVQGESVMRNEGMFGFDWAIFKDMPLDGYADMRIKIFTTDPADILRNRFDRTEALSGWDRNDTLIGDDRVQDVIDPLEPEPVVIENVFINDELTEEGVDRIAGFRDLFGDFANAPGSDFFFDRGNVLLGGRGSDVIQGGGGDDLIDGDAWLNVRIGINDQNGVEIGTAEHMQGEVRMYNPLDARNGQALHELLFERRLGVDQLSIVREILNADGATSNPVDLDTAVYQDVFGNYTITVNPDDTITVEHTNGDPRGGGAFHDGTDLLRNIERLRFSDGDGGTVDILVSQLGTNLNAAPVAVLAISDPSPTNRDILAPVITSLADANGLRATTLITLQWQSSADGGVTWTDIAGAGATAAFSDLATLQAETFRPGDAEVGLSLRYVLTYVDNLGFSNTAASPATGIVGDIFTGTNGAETINGTAGADLVNARRGDDLINGNAGDDVLNGDAGADTINGGIGNDTLNGGNGTDLLNGGAGDDVLSGGNGNDTVNGGAGNDTIQFAIGDETDAVNGGADTDLLEIIGGAANETLDVTLSGGVITTFEGGSLTAVEAVTASLGAGTDALVYTSAAGVTVNLAAGTATGFNSIAGIENVTGGAGADTLVGDDNANVLNGGAQADVLTGGGGADTINTGAGNDNLADLIRFSAIGEAGDTIANLDVTGAVAVIDKVQFGGALRTLLDDGTIDTAFQFVTGNGANGGNTAVNLNATNEALFLAGTNGEGVTDANITSATAVAAEFNAEFAITAATGEATLLVINSTNTDRATVWQWVQAAGGTAEVDASELTLIATITANDNVRTDSFGFF